MNTATMKNWGFTSDQNGFMPQELVGYQLRGFVYGDTSGRFTDGDYIRTSTVRAVTDHGDHKVVATKNTLYTIRPEDIDPEYEAQFPGAYARIPVKQERKDNP